MILFMQTYTIFNCLNSTSEICEMSIKVFDVAQTITPLQQMLTLDSLKLNQKEELGKYKTLKRINIGFSNLLERMCIFSQAIFPSMKGILPVMWFIWISIWHNHLHKTQSMCYRPSPLTTINICNRIYNQTFSRSESNTKVPLLMSKEHSDRVTELVGHSEINLIRMWKDFLHYHPATYCHV